MSNCVFSNPGLFKNPIPEVPEYLDASLILPDVSKFDFIAPDDKHLEPPVKE